MATLRQSPRAYMKNERASRPLRFLLSPVLHYLRTWDCLAATRVDSYVANSSAVARRIGKFYRRDSEIVHPPQEFPQYHPGYYAVFWLDPEGFMLEAVCHKNDV